jgi:hypothetical protein
VDRSRIALLGPLAPWRGGLSQYLGLLGEALRPRAEVRGWTFTRQYPGFLFPGESQVDPNATLPTFPVERTLDSIGPPSWRRTAAALERFAPVDPVLRARVRLGGGAAAGARHARRAGVRQSGATRAPSVRSGAHPLDAA